MIVMKNKEKNGHNGQILFFTDGMDYYRSTQSCLEELKKFKNELKFTCPINTYGFGMYDDINTDQLV
tara:strand:- start:141 stop:341 length:201 start_codon:yes stop_codon:yes gene_type:complete